MNNKKNLQVLYNAWNGCTRCDLSKSREGDGIFFGYGSLTAKYFVVGAAPTESDESVAGIFAGREGGVLLDAMLEVGIDPDDCYFTYAVSCRPKVFIPATEQEKAKVEGRAPNRDELTACRPRLYEILYQVDPRAVITLGEWATKTMIRGRLPKYTEAVGKQYACVLPAAVKEDHVEKKTVGKSRYLDVTYPVFAVPDMSTILSNPSTADHGPHNVLHRSLSRIRTYVDFVLHNEAETMKGPRP